MTPSIDELASTYFPGCPDAAPPLKSLIDLLADYASGRAVAPRGAARRDQLERLAKMAEALAAGLDELDPETRALAVLGFNPSEAGDQPSVAAERAPRSVGQPSKLAAFSDFQMTLAAIARLGRGLRWLAEVEPVRSVGREPRDDVVTFGVGCLLDIWRAFRDDEPTQSNKRGGFGALAAEFFDGPPFSFTSASVRHAVAHALPSGRQAARHR